jgi:hypothetical protein
MNKVFITFGGGSGPDNLSHHKNIKDACNRLVLQANDINLFNKTIGYTDEYLKNNPEFWDKHGEFINKNKRGYGYWLWKPYVIKKTMEEMSDGDILLWADAGCEIDKRHGQQMNNLFNEVKQKHILYMGTGFSEIVYTKKDLFVKLGMYNEENGRSQQISATTIMFLINEKTRLLINEWYELACNYHLINDTPSISNESEIILSIPNTDIWFPKYIKFSEHRHDQSIFSLLAKKYNYNTGGILYGNRAIITRRNRTGVSQLK